GKPANGSESAADVAELTKAIADAKGEGKDPGPGEDVPLLLSAPVKIGELLAPYTRAGRAMVLASPGLAVAGDFEYARSGFGLPETTPGVSLAADRVEQTLLGLPTDVPEPNAPHAQRSLEETLIKLATALGGRLVALFPSHAAL